MPETTIPNTPTFVLVGHGMVGQRFLESLAARGLTPAAGRARVVVLCEEPRPAYDRVQLTSYFAGRSPEELSLVEPEFMEKHGFELYVGDPAGSVDREARTVTARSGAVFPYDTLVLATGSYPFVPPVPGKDTRGCFVYRTIEDLLAIEEYAKGAETGAVVGGGLLGLEAAGALKGLGLRTHVVEFAPRLMPVQVAVVRIAHADGWVTVCDRALLSPGRGAAVLLPDGGQAALFMDRSGAVRAIGNRDPFTGAYVLSRGLLGTADGRPFVASPLLKQRFDLATGVCLDDEEVSVPVYAVRVE
ncbi:Nitric oxide reductase FlRd-NAD(+) reductase [Streptomyces microflavus]